MVRARLIDWDSLGKEIHEENVKVGWWKPWKKKKDRTQTALMLAISELSEGLEGFRKDLMDDHLPQYPMLHVELADCAIRLLDLKGALDYKFKEYQSVNFSEIHYSFLEKSVPEKLYFIASALCYANHHIGIVTALTAIEVMQYQHGFDLLIIMNEKRKYNRHRADHKEENRNKPNGKKI